MEKLAEMLSKNEYNASYDSERNVMTIPEKNIAVYPEKSCYTVRFRFEEQDFELSVGDYEVLCDFLKDILSGVINFSRCDDCNIRMDNWIIRRKSKKLSLLHKIFDFILAVGLLIFSVPFIIALPFFVDFSSIECLIECTPFVVGLDGLTLAISLIHHALTKNPLSIGGVVTYSFGVNILWFAVCMLMVTFGKIHESTTSETIIMTVLFTFILAIGILLVVLGLRFDKSTQSYPVFLRRLPILPSQEDTDRIINAVAEKMQKETILIKLNIEKKPTIFDSKFGGVPYWDLSKPYPVDYCGNKMQMLVQFNLEEVPENEKLPQKGMLQFFISVDAAECKVVWHEKIDRLIKASAMQEIEIPHSDFFEGECGMDFEKTVFPIVCRNQKSSRIMHSVASEIGITLDDTLEFYELTDNCDNFSNVDSEVTYLLGNPYFINYDDINPDNYDTLLLQIDLIQNEKFSAYWGECGAAYFFINGQKLSKHNFDDVFVGYETY